MEEPISELAFQSTEQSLKLAQAQITVRRMDFQARIEQADGTRKMVLIELQKAKLYQQTGRFRRYLGQQYQRNLQAVPAAAERAFSTCQAIARSPKRLLSDARPGQPATALPRTALPQTAKSPQTAPGPRSSWLG